MSQNSFFKNGRIIGECGRIIGECDRILIFRKITVPFTHHTRFGRIFSNFLKIEITSEFFHPHEFSNTAAYSTTLDSISTRLVVAASGLCPAQRLALSPVEWNAV
jgi:hypothetical protein